jgi:HEAT repeat protein
MNPMRNDSVKGELPPHYEELRKAANRNANWRERLKAVEELGNWKNPKTIDILKRLAADDAVYKVQEAAYRKLKKLGEHVPAPVRKKGDLIKGTTKILVRIKKSLPEGHTLDEFKEKLQKMRMDLYDTYEGELGADFDQWLANKWLSLSNKEENQ